MTTLIHNVRLAGETEHDTYILIDGERIAAVGKTSQAPHPTADNVIDGKGCLLIPGAIDCHVHFREPGMTEKADIATESHAAIAGGVTSYLEMPNTKPATTTIHSWEEKMQLGEEKSAANYAFFIGATNNNIEELKLADYTRIPGVKLFMGSSTGNMLVDDESTIGRLFSEIDAIVAVHAEDQAIIEENTKIFKEQGRGAASSHQLKAGINVMPIEEAGVEDLPIDYHTRIRSTEACYRSTSKAVELALKYKHRLHICHLTTEAELSLLNYGDPGNKLITSEVSPHHLMWTSDDYSTQGSRIKMNPAVKSATDRAALRKAVNDGLIDIVATDHAPHLLSQKCGGALKAVSGAPLVQFSLPWMLSNFDEKTVQRVMCQGPAEVFHIAERGSLKIGNYADLVIIEQVEPYTVSDNDVISKCGWTPLQGQKLRHRICQTWVNGQCVYREGEFTGAKAAKPLRFTKR